MDSGHSGEPAWSKRSHSALICEDEAEVVKVLYFCNATKHNQLAYIKMLYN